MATLGGWIAFTLTLTLLEAWESGSSVYELIAIVSDLYSYMFHLHHLVWDICNSSVKGRLSSTKKHIFFQDQDNYMPSPSPPPQCSIPKEHDLGTFCFVLVNNSAKCDHSRVWKWQGESTLWVNGIPKKYEECQISVLRSRGAPFASRCCRDRTKSRSRSTILVSLSSD